MPRDIKEKYKKDKSTDYFVFNQNKMEESKKKKNLEGKFKETRSFPDAVEFLSMVKKANRLPGVYMGKSSISYRNSRKSHKYNE